MNFDMLAIPRTRPIPTMRCSSSISARACGGGEELQLMKYANVNTAATPLLNEAVRGDPNIYPHRHPGEAVPEPPRSQEFQRLLTRTWTRFKPANERRTSVLRRS